MKKYLFIALAATALASCSSDEVVELNEGNEIKFSVVADNDSRAATVYCNNNLMNNFYVYANDGTNAFINADLITSTNGQNWLNSTATKRYWPEDGKLNFYAVVLEDENGLVKPTVDDKCVPSITDFTPNTDVTKQTDLLYAATLEQGRDDNNGTVALNFRHALSQIEFQAKNTNEYIDVQIEKVVVGNAVAKGSLAMPTASTSDKYGVHNSGTNENTTISAQGQWTLAEGNANYVVDSYDASAFLGTNSVVNLTCADGDDSKSKVWGKTMLLLPQATNSDDVWNTTVAVTPEGDATTGTYLGVKCKIYNVTTVNGNPVKTPIYGKDGYKWALVPIAFNWEQGKKYVYTFLFETGNGGYQPGGDEVLDDISLTVTVDDFILGEQPDDVKMETVTE